MTKKKVMPKKKTVTNKTVKKRITNKKAAASKPGKSPFKSKLGHDPLAWISGDDAEDLGIAYDDIDAKRDTLAQLEQVLPSVDKTEENAESNDIEETQTLSADEGWGLFDDEPVEKANDASLSEENSGQEAATSYAPVASDDGSWGLFGDEPASELPVGEGVAWGLFAEDDDATVEHDAIIINLPAVFNVAEVSRVYHELDNYLHKNHDLIIDASQVETIDASGLQLLFAVQKELKKRDCKMVLKDTSERTNVLSRSSFINELIGIEA